MLDVSTSPLHSAQPELMVVRGLLRRLNRCTHRYIPCPYSRSSAIPPAVPPPHLSISMPSMPFRVICSCSLEHRVIGSRVVCQRSKTFKRSRSTSVANTLFLLVWIPLTSLFLPHATVDNYRPHLPQFWTLALLVMRWIYRHLQYKEVGKRYSLCDKALLTYLVRIHIQPSLRRLFRNFAIPILPILNASTIWVRLGQFQLKVVDIASFRGLGHPATVDMHHGRVGQGVGRGSGHVALAGWRSRGI